MLKVFVNWLQPLFCLFTASIVSLPYFVSLFATDLKQKHNSPKFEKYLITDAVVIILVTILTRSFWHPQPKLQRQLKWTRYHYNQCNPFPTPLWIHQITRLSLKRQTPVKVKSLPLQVKTASSSEALFSPSKDHLSWSPFWVCKKLSLTNF